MIESTHTRIASLSVYTREALSHARREFAPFCAVETRCAGAEALEVTVSPRQDVDADFRAVCLEFWNFALEASCQQRLES